MGCSPSGKALSVLFSTPRLTQLPPGSPVGATCDIFLWGEACILGEGNGNPLQSSCLENPMDGGAWWAAVHGVAKSWIGLSKFTFTFHFHTLEKEMATHSSVLARRIPGMGEPGGLPSMGSHSIGHNRSDLAAAACILFYLASRPPPRQSPFQGPPRRTIFIPTLTTISSMSSSSRRCAFLARSHLHAAWGLPHAAGVFHSPI